MNRLEELKNIFNDVDSDIKTVIEPLIEDVIFLEERMKELKKLPFIKINQNDPTQQKTTPAAKQYKEFSQSYMNAIRILCSLLHKQDNGAENELLKRLEGFKI